MNKQIIKDLKDLPNVVKIEEIKEVKEEKEEVKAEEKKEEVKVEEVKKDVEKEAKEEAKEETKEEIKEEDLSESIKVISKDTIKITVGKKFNTFSQSWFPIITLVGNFLKKAGFYTGEIVTVKVIRRGVMLLVANSTEEEIEKIERLINK